MTLAVGCGGETTPSKTDDTPTKKAVDPNPGKRANKPIRAHPGERGPAGHVRAPEPPSAPQPITPNAEVVDTGVQGINFKVPVQWGPREVSPGGMRVAQWDLPGPGGGASLVFYRFPGGGSVEANISRWVGQVAQPDGGPSAEAATKATIEVAPFKVSTVDVSGKYESKMPGAAQVIPDARLLAAVVEGVEGDPYFVKLVGAKSTVDIWAGAVTKMYESFVPQIAKPQ